MSYKIIQISGQPIAETTVQHVTCDDIINPDISVQIKAFDQESNECLEDTKFIIDDSNGFFN